MLICYTIISTVWACGSFLRRCFPKKAIDARVISIGNLQAGGAGKTPVVISLVLRLKELGWKVAVQLRGYKSLAEHQGACILDYTPDLDTNFFGDEALLIAKKTQAPVIIGKNRKQVLDRYLKKEYDVVILDDGFAVPIKKNCNILLLTPAKFGSRFFKHFPFEIRFADIVIGTKGRNVKCEEQLERQFTLSSTPHRPLWLICAVADPHDVIKTLYRLGYQPQRKLFLSDHYHYQEKEICQWIQTAEQNQLQILITEKDAIKWEGFLNCVIVLKQEISIHESLLQQILNYLR